MSMTRRRLLRALLATPLAAFVDVEQLLWTPGQMVSVTGPRTCGLLQPGDIFTLEGRYRMDPVTRTMTNELQRWVILSPAVVASLKGTPAAKCPPDIAPVSGA